MYRLSSLALPSDAVTVPSSLKAFGSRKRLSSPSRDSRTYHTLWFCNPSFFDKKYRSPIFRGIPIFS